MASQGEFMGLNEEQKSMLTAFSDMKFDDHEYLEQALQGSKTPEVLENLTAIIQTISRRIHQHVGSHHQHLIKQAEHIKEVSKNLTNAKERVVRVRAVYNRAKSRVLSPYQQLKTAVMQLGFIQKASRIAVQTLRVVTKQKQLQAQVSLVEEKGSARDAVKCARLIKDIYQVFGETDLSGIRLVEEQIAAIETAKKRVKSQASVRMRQGIGALNQSEIAASLQAFYLLGCLREEVDKAVNSLIKNVVVRVRESLDVSKIAESKGKSSGSSAAGALRSELWRRLDQALNNLFEAGVQVWNLQQVLLKKRDPSRFIPFLSVYLNPTLHALAHPQKTKLPADDKEEPIKTPPNKPESLVRVFTTKIVQGLREELTAAYRSTSFVKTVLVGEFPRLHRMLRAVFNRLAQATNSGIGVELKRRNKLFPSAKSNGKSLEAASSPKAAGSVFEYESELEQLIQAWEHGVMLEDGHKSNTTHNSPLYQITSVYEMAYLKLIITRLQDPVKKMFSGVANGRYPLEPEAQTFVTAFDDALRGVRLSGTDLQTQIANSVKQAVNLLVAQSEHHCDVKVTSTSQSNSKNQAIYKVLSIVDVGLEGWVDNAEGLYSSRCLKEAMDMLRQARKACDALSVYTKPIPYTYIY
ncbi:hypothetical protein AAMO2058_001613200 [Amorphochlora amoebiformis]